MSLAQCTACHGEGYIVVRVDIMETVAGKHGMEAEVRQCFCTNGGTWAATVMRRIHTENIKLGRQPYDREPIPEEQDKTTLMEILNKRKQEGRWKP